MDRESVPAPVQFRGRPALKFAGMVNTSVDEVKVVEVKVTGWIRYGGVPVSVIVGEPMSSWIVLYGFALAWATAQLKVPVTEVSPESLAEVTVYVPAQAGHAAAPSPISSTVAQACARRLRRGDPPACFDP